MVEAATGKIEPLAVIRYEDDKGVGGVVVSSDCGIEPRDARIQIRQLCLIQLLDAPHLIGRAAGSAKQATHVAITFRAFHRVGGLHRPRVHPEVVVNGVGLQEEKKGAIARSKSFEPDRAIKELRPSELDAFAVSR